MAIKSQCQHKTQVCLKYNGQQQRYNNNNNEDDDDNVVNNFLQLSIISVKTINSEMFDIFFQAIFLCSSFYLKVTFFKVAPKVGYFCEENFHLAFSKLAQSGHTAKNTP